MTTTKQRQVRSPQRASIAATDRVAHADPLTTHRRTAGALAGIGAVAMGMGGALYTVAGADLWGVADRNVPVQTFLADAASSVSILHANQSVWIVGVVMLAMGGILMTRRQGDPASIAARASYTIGAAIAIPAFLTMATLTRLAERDDASPDLVETLAFLGARMDDVATILLVGLCPVLVSLAGRRIWMPSWLVTWGMLCGAAGALSAVAIYLGLSASLGTVLVPVGILWTIAAGVVTFRSTD